MNKPLVDAESDTTRRGQTAMPASELWITRCAVDANGVRAEWVESVVATAGQETIIFFRPGKGSTQTDEHDHAVRLALVTGARVLRVVCTTAVDGATAYAWLLGEGLDLNATKLAGSTALLAAVRAEAIDRGLPLPMDVPGPPSTRADNVPGHHS